MSSPLLRADDKIILKEGKVIHGRIEDETPDSVTIRFNSTMVLRVEREKIREIVREKKTKSPANTVTLDDVKKQTEKKKEEAGPAIKNPAPEVKTRTSKKGAVWIEEKLVQTVYDVRSPERNDRIPVVDSHLDFSTKVSPRKESGGTRWESVVVIATITIHRPRWDHPKKPDPADIEKWNSYFDLVEADVQERVDIYLRSLVGAGEKAAALRLPTENDLKKRTDQIMAEERRRIEKRLRGYERRHRVKFPKK